MSMGQRISKLRKEKNLSQEYVAERLGVSRQAVSKWETDTSAPDTYNLISLSELFNVSVEYLATGNQSENNYEEPKRNNLSVQKIIGIILLIVGLVSSIVSIVIESHFLFFVLSVPLVIFGILALLLRKKVLIFVVLIFLSLVILLLALSLTNIVWGIILLAISIAIFCVSFRAFKK